MSDLTNVFTDIANSLRSKTGTSDPIKPTEMSGIINNISGGLSNITYTNCESEDDLFNNAPYMVSIDKNIDPSLNAPNRIVTADYMGYNLSGIEYAPGGSKNLIYWKNSSDCSGVLSGYTSNFNEKASFRFGDSVTDISSCFYNCGNFNSPVIIGNNVQYMDYTFYYCNSFNQPITIPDSVTSMVNTFRSCWNFNKPITISNNVTSMADTFNYCSNFNQPITIPNNVTNMSSTFERCFNFNRPITIPNKVTNMDSTFMYCTNFNQPITIPDKVTDMDYTFYSCRYFNQPITIPDKVYDMTCTFSGCNNFNQPITIPGNVTDVARCFENCYNLAGNIYFKNSSKIVTSSYVYTYNMLGNRNTTKRLNIRCNNATPFITYTNANSIVGATVTWTRSTNRYYNALYNVYIYYNWTG